MKYKITIGRSPDNDVVIDDASVSRKHAVLVLKNGNRIIRDLESTNGTFVNGKRITSARISARDKIQLGSVLVSAKDLLAFLEKKTEEFVPVKTLKIGRAPENDYFVENPLISAFHAELQISEEGKVKIIDKNSTNGTFVNHIKIQEKILVPEDKVLLAGEVELPWKKLLQNKEQTRKNKENTPARETSIPIKIFTVFGLLGMIAGYFLFSYFNTQTEMSRDISADTTRREAPSPPVQKRIVHSSEDCFPSAFQGKAPEIYFPEKISHKIAYRCSGNQAYKTLREAIQKADFKSSEVRNLSVCWASAYPGNFNIGQACAIYDSLRKYWRYVNDPRGSEYFAKASETIKKLKFKGDCDDFAIALYAMISAVGGYPRMNFAYNPKGGHAFVELYVGEKNSEQLKKVYEFLFEKYDMDRIHFRTYKNQIWINMDWFADFPAGSYFPYTSCYTIDPLNKRCFKERK